MDVLSKLQVLSDASQYDLACACGTNGSDRRRRGTDGAWLYPVSLPRGGFSVMLKTLMSNVCVNDCKYCPYRNTVDVPRCTIGSDEMARLFMEYVNQKKVFGLFLSSGVVKSPDSTMELLNDTARILRSRYQYRGHIHLKVIPGASEGAIEDALSLANAVSVNIETPGEKHCANLSSRKDYYRDIIGPLKFINEMTSRKVEFRKIRKTTQFIVGASDETDAEVIKYTAGLYTKLKLNRVYFSAYQRGLGDKSIPGEQRVFNSCEDNFLREHRLYQTDFLLRSYGFKSDDVIFNQQGNLALDKDPKQTWAMGHPEFFPVNVNRAGVMELLRVPGIGPLTAQRIVSLRREAKFGNADRLPLKGRRLDLARQFISV
ncbi:MAG TPA: helix-hairpin-helix domain-containing protein [Chitinispirillaceae bacterium]|nr:helix-hairpin-helix domain-containing protein [Chitinispirillaceae bacterium]